MTALILVAFAAPAGAADPMDAYFDKTSAEPRCKAAAGSDIVVCGRRYADKYRVPFLIPTRGDPKTRGVHDERAMLIAQESPCQSLGPYLIGCGAVGVSVSTKFGGGKIEYRPLAP
jgi:hypothetical protein